MRFFLIVILFFRQEIHANRNFLLDNVDENLTTGQNPSSENLPVEQVEAVNLVTGHSFSYEVGPQGELREIHGVGTVLVKFV